MQTATSETESKSLDLSICVHHYTLRAPCPKGQGTLPNGSPTLFNEGKGFNERPTAPKNAQLKADALSTNLQRFPNGNGIRWAT